MPAKWQSTFQDANKTVIDGMLNGMHTYFNKQYTKDPYKSMHDPDQSIDPNDSDKNSYNKSDNTTDKPKIVDNQDKTANNQGNLGTSATLKPFKSMNSNRCPLPNHQGHMWGLCRQNKYNNATLAACCSSDTHMYPSTRS